jgi:hypothetical protein
MKRCCSHHGPTRYTIEVFFYRFTGMISNIIKVSSQGATTRLEDCAHPKKVKKIHWSERILKY